jgi:hypothetical protein
MMCVDQQQLEACHLFEHVPHRLPVDAGGLHRDLRDSLGHQPITQPTQVRAEGSELAHLLAPLVRLAGDANARRHGVLVDVERRRPSHNHFIGQPPPQGRLLSVRRSP